MKGGVSPSNDRYFFFPTTMILKIDNVICNTETATRMRKHTRVTREELTPRVTLIKKELPCHPRHNTDFWFSYVTVEKYVDDTLVKTYCWIEKITKEEKEQFLLIENTTEPLTQRGKDRKEYMKAYYNKHKDKYKYTSTPEKKEKAKIYREEHKEQLRENARKWYQLHRDEKLQKMKEYNKKKKLLNN